MEIKSLNQLKTRITQRKEAAQKKKFWLRLTNFCNNNCVFCLDSVHHNGTSRSILALKKEMEQGISEGSVKLILSGGEPTLHPHFLRIVELAKTLGYAQVQVVTNGRMFYYRSFLNKAVAAGVSEITFSMHGHTKTLYEKQSGVTGSFAQAMAGLTNALESNRLIINIDIVINKINYRHLEDIMRFFISRNITEFDLLQVTPFGSAWKNKEKVLYTIPAAAPYLKKAFQLQYEFPDIYIWTNRFPARFLEGFEELIQHPEKLKDEIRGRMSLFSRFIKRGELMPCFGAQCRYCFIEDFCNDLVKLKKDKQIVSKETGVCIQTHRRRFKRFLTQGTIDINAFLDFFINERFFLKSLRCDLCKAHKNCNGAPIRLIREKGFKILKNI
ncbi:MAG: radical SAM protein [Candidatus Omnitrophota bacterium]|jgi:MoaA/NifB/PqqE/SkfB family radical SAM enzyme